MKFLVDAQLPVRLARFLNDAGHDAVHVSSLADGYRTTDAAIMALADREGRIVISKDADFRHSHITDGSPARLLVIGVGNISNNDLIALFEERIDQIVTGLTTTTFVELRRGLLVLHTARTE